MATSTLTREWLADRPYVAVCTAITLVLVSVLTLARSSEGKNGVPRLPSAVPYVTNTYHFMTNMRKFLRRSRDHLARTSKDIISWNLTPWIKVYLITSPRHVQAIFRPTPAVSSDKFFHLIYENMWGAPLADRAKFLADKSGRGKVPLPGYEDTPPDQRYFARLHAITHDNLTVTAKTNALGEVFCRLFEEELENRFPIGQPIVGGVKSLLDGEMANAATATLAGKGMLKRWPNLIDMLWDLDEIAGSLVWGLPRWMNRSSCDKRDRFRDACGLYIKEVLEQGYDLEGEKADWEPVMGSSFQRELVRWMRDAGFSWETVGGAIMVTMIFGSNGNSTPVTAWFLIEIIKDPSLFEAVREEVMTAYVTDPQTGARSIDPQKLVSLPLLQSIYVESLRLHVSMNVTRELMAPFDLGSYKLEKGALIQACTEISHLDEEVWGDKDHPASEFWAARHIRYVDETGEKGEVKRVPQFSMAGKQNDWFPFGGGISMCPGRHFAKQEIMLTIAILVARFDIEFVEWVNKDGTPSDRPAEDDINYAGAASVPPDREMKVRWTRRW